LHGRLGESQGRTTCDGEEKHLPLSVTNSECTIRSLITKIKEA